MGMFDLDLDNPYGIYSLPAGTGMLIIGSAAGVVNGMKKYHFWHKNISWFAALGYLTEPVHFIVSKFNSF